MTIRQSDVETSQTPYWYKLLRHFEKKGYVHNGLTIPFLIGARERLEPEENLLTIEQLTISINEIGGTVLRCQSIGEFVIGTPDPETRGYLKIIDNIGVSDNSLDMINNIEELISHFEGNYHEMINRREYSKNYGIWEYFTEIELSRIDEMKKS
jgi:hypothetical protein